MLASGFKKQFVVTEQIFVYNVCLQLCFSEKGKKTHETFHIFETFHILKMNAHFEKEPHFENESIFLEKWKAINPFFKKTATSK